MAFYWQKRIAEYQSKLNKSRAKKSRKLKRMHEKAKLQAKHYINTALRQTVRKLHELGVSKIVVGYPKGTARNPEKGRKQNFLLSHVWRFSIKGLALFVVFIRVPQRGLSPTLIWLEPSTF
ncbi:hypothetical protein APY94_04195 [Thermococcus celericrescens]|uniref:Probable transposase IS891/IS1136/IS1341 domain-containing protein n=1 Tax=Thermococcus celericrescens TaxID=227598 RepID=A0A117ITQ7_9EURY|nr:hypothetical protein APY94_04195 [Thermococcus celericrescens]